MCDWPEAGDEIDPQSWEDERPRIDDEDDFDKENHLDE